MNNINQSTLELLKSLDKIKNEVELLVKSIDIQRIDFTEAVKTQILELDKEIKSLEKETVLLHSVPTKLTNQLNEIIPSISVELNKMNQLKIKELYDANKKSRQDHDNLISDAASRLEEIKENIVKIDSRRIKRYFLFFVVTLVFSVLLSLGSTYDMLKKFPQRVHIQSPENITVQESEVSLWSSKNVNVSGGIIKKGDDVMIGSFLTYNPLKNI